MLEGLSKVEMNTVHGSRRGVLYFRAGKMFVDSSAFAFVGTYTGPASGEVLAEMLTLRQTPINREASPPIAPVGQGGISNGLYSIHIRMLDSGNTGVRCSKTVKSTLATRHSITLAPTPV